MSKKTGSDSGPHDGELVRLTLEEMGPLGDTRAHHRGGVVHVFGGIPGEDVVARIVRRRGRRNRRVHGQVVEVLKPSPNRVAPPCPYFGPCTGCQWQHIEYTHQLLLKQQAVEEHLKLHPALNGVQVSPTLPAGEPFGYRNHARFTIRNRGTLGYMNRITGAFVKVDDCMLMAPWISEALRSLQGRCQETTQLSIRYGLNTGEWLIQPTLHSLEVPLASGQPHYSERLKDKTFRIGSPSFFQVNTGEAVRLVDLVRARLDLSGDELLVDAYAGVGTFAVLLAPFVRHVIAIEESEAAVGDAAVNTEGIGNLEFVQAKTEEAIVRLSETPDALILDPPRVGCHPDALSAVVRRPPRRLVYVSCDPEALARDLSTLVLGGLRIEAVEPIDMFPQTHHVECVATLTHDG